MWPRSDAWECGAGVRLRVSLQVWDKGRNLALLPRPWAGRLGGALAGGDNKLSSNTQVVCLFQGLALGCPGDFELFQKHSSQELGSPPTSSPPWSRPGAESTTAPTAGQEGLSITVWSP